MLSDYMKEARSFSMKSNSREREVGFHASSGGYCLKKLIIETLMPQYKQAFSEEVLSIFEIGHEIHEKQDKDLRLLAQEKAEFLWIQPFRIKAMSNILLDLFEERNKDTEHKVTSPIPLCVFGTPDAIIYDFSTNSLLIPDFKSTNGRSFSYKVKGSKSLPNMIQLGTYIESIVSKLKSTGMNIDIEEASIIYIDKDDYFNKGKLSLCTHLYSAESISSAAQTYWKNAGDALYDFVSSLGTIMPSTQIATGSNKWMCNYCSIFKDKTECNKAIDLVTLKELKGEAID